MFHLKGFVGLFSLLPKSLSLFFVSFVSSSFLKVFQVHLVANILNSLTDFKRNVSYLFKMKFVRNELKLQNDYLYSCIQSKIKVLPQHTGLSDSV